MVFIWRQTTTDLLLPAVIVTTSKWLKISRRRLADYVKKLRQKARPTCSMIIFPLSTNQIIDLRRCYFLNFLVSWKQQLPGQRTNLIGSPLINRGFIANIYFLSRFRIHLQSVASITEKKRSSNNSNVTDKKHHSFSTSIITPFHAKINQIANAITNSATITAPTISQSSKSRRIQQKPEKRKKKMDQIHF